MSRSITNDESTSKRPVPYDVFIYIKHFSQLPNAENFKTSGGSTMSGVTHVLDRCWSKNYASFDTPSLSTFTEKYKDCSIVIEFLKDPNIECMKISSAGGNGYDHEFTKISRKE